MGGLSLAVAGVAWYGRHRGDAEAARGTEQLLGVMLMAVGLGCVFAGRGQAGRLLVFMATAIGSLAL
jgi:hypothetical protein